jgi:serine/threonine protein phosphatase PrpC
MEHVVTNTVRLSTPETVGQVSVVGNPGRLLLTTDGVHKRLGHDELSAILTGGSDSRATAARLVVSALHAGGTDNATALVVDSPARMSTMSTVA